MAHQSTNGSNTAFVTRMAPTPESKEQEDLTPSDSQPPGVDDEPQSLEEALTG